MLRASARACGLDKAHLLKAHSAKQSAMRLVNCYIGKGELTSREKDTLAHQRATGTDKTAAAYNPQELVVPVAKYTAILQAWVAGTYVLPAQALLASPTVGVAALTQPEPEVERVRRDDAVPEGAEDEPLDYETPEDAQHAARAAGALQSRVLAHLRAQVGVPEPGHGGPSGLVRGYLTASVWGNSTEKGLRYAHMVVLKQQTLNLPFRDRTKKRVSVTVNGEELEVLCDWPLHKHPLWQEPTYSRDAPAQEGRVLCKRCLGRERAWCLRQQDSDVAGIRRTGARKRTRSDAQ